MFLSKGKLVSRVLGIPSKNSSWIILRIVKREMSAMVSSFPQACPRPIVPLLSWFLCTRRSMFCRNTLSEPSDEMSSLRILSFLSGFFSRRLGLSSSMESLTPSTISSTLSASKGSSGYNPENLPTYRKKALLWATISPFTSKTGTWPKGSLGFSSCIESRSTKSFSYLILASFKAALTAPALPAILKYTTFTFFGLRDALDIIVCSRQSPTPTRIPVPQASQRFFVVEVVVLVKKTSAIGLSSVVKDQTPLGSEH
mmetsp:Transcript_148/g.571  ORF Transcript_148/g.571 Transcript_148/m.571 type:complete len:256 (-) Transcript_148:1079-1846(-)